MLTNEERRVKIYENDKAPTDPTTVNALTPLADLSLNWREKDLPQRLRTRHVHGLHPYLGKYIPQLVEIFARKYFKPGQLVLDPFCGSGTTLVQLNELGINSIGSDISAFNVMLCKVKTQEYDLDQVTYEINDILEKTQAATTPKRLESGQLPLFTFPGNGSVLSGETQNEYLNTWYAPQALKELLTYLKFTESQSYKYSDVLKIILTRSARSARQTTHFDLDFPDKPQKEPYWCYKHSRTCYPVDEALKFLKRYSIDTIKRLKEFSLKRTKASVSVHHVDSRKFNFPEIDGVITSPPYVGLIDYHEQHAYAYALLGLKDLREKEIGPAVDGVSNNAKRKYQEQIAEVFRNTMDSMPVGGRLIVIAGDKHGLYDEIAELAGVEVDAVVNRHVNRRTGRRSSEFYESVFIWRKL